MGAQWLGARKVFCYLVSTRELFSETLTGLVTPLGAHGHHQAFSSRLKDACKSTDDFAQWNLVLPSDSDLFGLCFEPARRRAEERWLWRIGWPFPFACKRSPASLNTDFAVALFLSNSMPRCIRRPGAVEALSSGACGVGAGAASTLLAGLSGASALLGICSLLSDRELCVVSAVADRSMERSLDFGDSNEMCSASFILDILRAW